MTSRMTASPLFRALFAARDHDARLQHLMEQLPAAAFLAAPRTGAFLAINGKAAALTEWARDELMARSLSEVVAAPAAGDALDQTHQLEPGQSRTLHAVPLQTRSGRSAVVDLRLSAFTEPPNNDRLVLLLASPADERLSQEREAAQQAQALASLEKLMELLAEPDESRLEPAVTLIAAMLGADSAALYHVSSEQPGLRLHTASPAPRPGANRPFPPALGPSEAHYLKSPLRWLASQRPEGYLHQSARAAGWAALLAHPVGDPPYIVGAICVAYRPGNPPPAQAQRLLGVAAQHLNQLTSLIGREAAFARSRELAVRLNARLAAINAEIEEGVVLVNHDGVLEEINGAAARTLGYRSEDVTGLPFDQILISDGPLASLVRQALQQPDATVAHECRLLRRSGEPFPAVVRVRPLATGGCALTVRDQSNMRDRMVQQEHLDQLAYVGQATQAFAHEVRSPLNNISTGVQFLAASFELDPEQARIAATIQAECARLSGLMTDMLAWAKPIHAQLAPTSLDGVLRRLLNRFARKIEQRNVRLNYSAEPEAPPVLVDARLMEQVFVNLIDNALQAMPAGGHLSISLGCSPRGANGRVVEVRLADSGPGISEEAQRRIFDPYFTTKPDGTGLGLAICKRLITIQRGAIGVESYPGTGTIFTVTLPAHDSPLPEQETL